MTPRFIVILVLSVVVYSSNLWGTSIYILDEAKNAGGAMEMLTRGDLVVPTFNGSLRTDKPPLHYYFMMIAYSLFGVTPFAARFFSAFAGILLVAIIYRQTKKLIGEPSAFYTALVILSSLQLTIQFHLAVPDPYLILILAVSLLSLFKGLHHDNNYFYLFYITSALGFLTKGLIAIVLPGLILVIYLVVQKKFRLAVLKRLKIFQGMLLFCVIALPWYFAVGHATRGLWLKGFFIEHNLERYTSTMEGHRGFMFAPFLILLVSTIPFCVFVVQAIGLTWREKNPFLIFCVIVCIVFGLFFSFSKTFLPSYPAPAIPFLAIVIGHYIAFLVTNFKDVSRVSVVVGTSFNMALGLAIPGMVYFALKEEGLEALTYMSAGFLVIPFGIALGYYYVTKRQPERMIYCWSASWILASLFFFFIAYPAVDKNNPVNRSLSILQNEQYATHRLVGYKVFNPAYVFTLRKAVYVIHSSGELAELAAREKIIVLTRAKYLEELSGNPTLHKLCENKDLFERNVTVVLSN